MNLKTLIIEPNEVIHLCTVCVTDNNGAKIALSIIVLALIFLGFGNWAWKKYFSNKKQTFQRK
jgi:membrane-anchored protein YejM (alkaline phosphatase superfamily)|tara:strand:- start:69 stop:257 length:189 start_codon:yes stop_codon:yes gene_type:complete